MVGVQYSIVDDKNFSGARDNGEDAWGVSFGFSLPIWWGKKRARVSESRERLDADRQALRQLEFDTHYEVADFYHRLQIALRQVKLYRDNVVPQAQQALEVSETAYSAVPPRVDFESVIDNQRNLLTFQLALERSRADFQKNMAELERIVGRSILEVSP